MKLLDLYCGAGMASDGYVAAGFEVHGVDMNDQPTYPYSFEQADALEVLLSNEPEKFDVIHASPPCRLTPVRSTCVKHRVARARPVTCSLRTCRYCRSGGVTRCGSWRTSPVHPAWTTLSSSAAQRTTWVSGDTVCSCPTFRWKVQAVKQGTRQAVGVYHVMGDSIPKGGRTALSLEHGLEVMGVDRSIPWDSLKEGFLSAYTEHLGKQLARCLSAA